jgi:formylglycine-generating enzyme required for sulfatase activity
MLLKVGFVFLLSLILLACASPSGDAGADVVSRPQALSSSITLSDVKDQKILQQLLADMVELPAGHFLMGDIHGVGEADELPVHRVEIKPFAMGRFEVSYEQFDLFSRMTKQPLLPARWGRGSRPVVGVSWQDAMEFIEWVSEASGVRLRLPTEAEWEYAARAGSASRYSYGDDEALLCEYGNIADSSTAIGWRNKSCSDGYETTAPVGSFKPNAFGLYDMHGNVWEWIGDCWFDTYRKAPSDGRPWLKSSACAVRSQRGGSWFYGAEEARSSYRSQGDEFDKSVTLGFRLAKDI